MRRAAESIPGNIAEGQRQLTSKGFIQYLSRARGSLNELETQAELAESSCHLARSELEPLMLDCIELGRMIHGRLNSTKDAGG
jgi:four helix bundle protein